MVPTEGVWKVFLHNIGLCPGPEHSQCDYTIRVDLNSDKHTVSYTFSVNDNVTGSVIVMLCP